MSRWVGVDPGEKRIGVARGDPLGFVAHPQAILGSYEELRDWISGQSEDLEGTGGVIIGLPRNMNGTYGPLAARSNVLIQRLRADLPQVTFVLWDERLTSRQAAQLPGVGRGQHIDDKAAAILLQSYLDAGCPQRPDPPDLGA